MLERLFQTESETSAQSRRRGWRTAHLFSNQTEKKEQMMLYVCVIHDVFISYHTLI